MITELKIKREVEETVKCDPGYRFPDEEESKLFHQLGNAPKDWEWWDGETWNPRRPEYTRGWSYHEAARHRYRIKLEPELIIHEGKRYEVVTDPSYLIQKGDLFWSKDSGRYWKPFENQSDWIKLGEYTPEEEARVARPLTQVYEGEVSSEFDYDGEILAQYVTIKGNNFKVGDRVKIEVIK